MNPYAEWLLIECQDRPDHYALLGIGRFESDPLRIAAAADRRVAQLRKAATKERLDLAKRIAREITEARDCLLATETRTAYESRLRGPAPGPSRSVFLPPKAYDEDEVDTDIVAEIEDDEAPLEGIAIPPSFATPLGAVALDAAVAAPPIVAPTPLEPTLAVRAPSVQPKRNGLPLPWLIAGSGALGLIAVLALVLVPKWLTPTKVAAAPSPPAAPAEVRTDFGYRPVAASTDRAPVPMFNPENPDAPATPEAPVEAPNAPEPEPAAAADGDDTMAATPDTPAMTDTPAPADAAPPMETMDPPAAPAAGMRSAEAAAENLKTTQANLATARRAMSDGDIDEAVSQVELADLEAIDAPAAEKVAETRAVLEYLRGFWRAADEGFLGLAAGNEFEFDGRTVVVVERTPQRLVIRSAGRNRGYERKQLPSKLALFLATRWLKPDDANTPLFLAAFHTFDADGDRAEARKLAETARTANTPGAEALLAELESPQ